MKLKFSRILIYLFLFFQSSVVLSQGEANRWYFGTFAGLDFTSGSPVAVTDGAMDTWEGCSSISDSLGNFLFYTDGTLIWDRTHTSMLAPGDSLSGSSSSTQSGVIIKKPGSKNIYYVFTADALGGTKGIQYTEINMTYRNGFGGVEPLRKNVKLRTPSLEKLTGIRHCNNRDIWVVSHDEGSNKFRTFLVTPNGVDTNAVVSAIGDVLTAGNGDHAGQLKAYLGGKKLSMAMIHGNLELYDFNQTTGVVSNRIVFNSAVIQSVYGTEFSPDGTKLYCSTFDPPSKIYQFNMCAGTNNDIANSAVLVGGSNHYGGSLQLGPDNKIYFTKWSPLPILVDSLAVINNPNNFGLTCGYNDNAVFLGGGGVRYSDLGLPNFVPYNLKNPISPFTSIVNCYKGSFNVPTLNNSSCMNINDTIVTSTWDFGDPSTGVRNTSNLKSPEHLFSTPGTYVVTLTLTYPCGEDILKQNVVIVAPDAGVIANQTISLGGSITLTTTGVGNYNWSTGESTNSITVSPSSSTTYWVAVSNGGCVDTAFTTIIVQVPLDISSVLSCSNGSFSAYLLNVSNCTGLNNPPNSITWNFGDPNSGVNNISNLENPSHIFSSEGTYTISLTLDYGSCKNFKTKDVNIVFPTAIVKSSSTILLGESKVLTVSGGTSYLWDTGDSTSQVTVSPTVTRFYCAKAINSAGCSDTGCVTIKVQIPIDIPNAFSPNGDGVNDKWNIKGIETYENVEVSLYNRWGQAILLKDDYKTSWDGTQNGVELPTASYYYVIDMEKGKYTYKGYVTLKR